MAGTDPSGLASDDEAWRLDRDDHGAPHLQKGARRYDAQTFKPIRHLGETPQPLSERDLREIIEQGIVGQYEAKKIPLPAELQALRNGYGKILKRGLKGSQAKLAAKALAKSIAKLGPLAIALFIHDLHASGAEAAVINAVIPADEITELLRASQEAFAEWLDEAHFEKQVERWMKAGFPRREAEREARDMIFREQMKRLDEVARQLRELDKETRCESR
jgi:hypothetical protein